MNCEILETLYIRSNGDIPCDCDAGEQLLLGKVVPDDPDWDIVKVTNNDQYAHIRTAFSSGVVPWDLCNSCGLLRKEEPFSDRLIEKRIRKVQFEPTLACNLDCPCCSSKSQRQTRPKPHLMKLNVFQTLLMSLSKSFYSIHEIEYCGQGDPLMHPQFPRFVEEARQYFPNAQQILVTNGNFDYWEHTQGVFLNTIYVSCDGVFQESYEKYRIGGDVSKAIRFMKEAPKSINGAKQNIIWKYILFEFNDSDEEIIAAQHMAHSLGVDMLMFVYTHSKFKSVKYTPENVSSLPIVRPNVTTSLTPHFLNENLGLNYKIPEIKDAHADSMYTRLFQSVVASFRKDR